MEHEFPEGYVHMKNTYGFQKSEKKFNQEVGSSKQYEKPVEIRMHISGSVLGEIGASNQRLAPAFSYSAWRQCYGHWRYFPHASAAFCARLNFPISRGVISVLVVKDIS